MKARKTEFAKIILTILILFFYLTDCYTQINSTNPNSNEEYNFRHLTMNEGLSQLTITKMIQDSKGYIWAATVNGLNRYDGYEFKVFTAKTDDPTSLTDNHITSLYEDNDGKIWVGTAAGGVNRYDRATGDFTHFDIFKNLTKPPYYKPDYQLPLSFSRNNQESITEFCDDGENIWIASWGYGLFCFNKKSGEVINFITSGEKNSISSNSITELFLYHGNLWIGTFGGGINQITLKTFKDYKKSKNIFSQSINEILHGKNILTIENENNNFWIGTFGNGLIKLELIIDSLGVAKLKEVNYSKNNKLLDVLSNLKITELKKDFLNNLWIATFGNGVFKLNFNNMQFTNFSHDPFNKNSIMDNDILSLNVDRSGVIWVGAHFGKGITLINRSVKKLGLLRKELGLNSGLNDEIVYSVLKDKNLLYIGTYKGGLNIYNRETSTTQYFTHDDGKNSISDDHIRSIAKDYKGNLWLGTYNGGLNFFNPNTKKFVSFTHEINDSKSLKANQVMKIVFKNDSLCWIGLFGGGLASFNLNQFYRTGKIDFQSYMHNSQSNNSLVDNRVYSTILDSKGDLWIATLGGINKLNTETITFETFKFSPTEKDFILLNSILTVCEDHFGNIWFGSQGGGLMLLDKKTKKIERYEHKYGLLSDVIYAILPDQQYIWFSGNEGLARFDTKNKNTVYFDMNDGIQSKEYSGSAYFKASDGEMFFGGVMGLNYFYPSKIEENKLIPSTAVTEIKIFNSPIKGEKDALELTYEDNFFMFTFSSLDFKSPEENQFAYFLEGYEKEWQYTDWKKRTAFYTNVPPGEYVFRVKSSNNDGVWNETGIAIQLIITPPFWKTLWFIISSGGIILFSVVYFLHKKIKLYVDVSKLKTKLAADLHDNVGSGLTEISILSELLNQEVHNLPVFSKNKLETIGNRSRELITNMSDIVWVVNPHKDTLHDLIVRLKDSSADITSYMNIGFNTMGLDKIENIKLPMEIKQNIYLVFKEAINNSIKHSKCTNISLNTKVYGKTIEMSLSDNGVGLDINDPNSGNGLRNIKLRAEEIGGHFSMFSKENNGTTIKLRCTVREKSIFNIASLRNKWK